MRCLIVLRKQNRLYCLVLLFAFAVMLIFNFMTPLSGDDFAHYFGAEDKHFSSLSDIFIGLRNLRNSINGRVVSHFFVYLMLCGYVSFSDFRKYWNDLRTHAYYGNSVAFY